MLAYRSPLLTLFRPINGPSLAKPKVRRPPQALTAKLLVNNILLTSNIVECNNSICLEETASNLFPRKTPKHPLKMPSHFCFTFQFLHLRKGKSVISLFRDPPPPSHTFPYFFRTPPPTAWYRILTLPHDVIDDVTEVGVTKEICREIVLQRRKFWWFF